MIKEAAVMFDLDGTLADISHRKPFGEGLDILGDTCIQPVAELTRLFYNHTSKKVLLVSGRSDTYKADTMVWLQRNHVLADKLFMRREGDYRPDEILKEELYREMIEPYYDVLLVFDDRPKVIRMWRSLGLRVADVGKGIEF